MYGFLTVVTVLIHFLWILFLIFGFMFALKRSRIALLHAAALLFTLILNLMGWYCPLTYLENFLRVLQGSDTAYAGSFIRKYLEYIIYPDLPEHVIRIGAILFVALYMAVYAYLIKRFHILDRIRMG